MPVASHFEIEPQILQSIRDLSLAGLTTVGDASTVAMVTDITRLCPAVILQAADGQYSIGVDGSVQTETQYWLLSVLVKHHKGTAQTTASTAGQFLTPILAELVGKVYANYAPIEIDERPIPEYNKGYAEFPVVLKTSFDVGGGA